jgi:Na+-transporting NADH:ubiquinone oxidoreductase subunit B/electron transport complex protein RnfD
MGETCRLVVLAGGLLLIALRVSNWRIPVSYIATVFVFAAVGNYFLPARFAPPLFQVLAGGLLFGAMFMATDPVTSPFTRAGKYVFGIGCGVLTVLIRSFSGYVEGVMFSIVIMNAFTPLIDQIVLMFKYRPVKA